MKNALIRTWAAPMALSLAVLAACGGGKAGVDAESGRPSLVSVEVGRIVDVYAYRRANTGPTESAAADRRERSKRDLVLIERDVVINPNLAAESLFDAAGNEVATADYEFLPFDKSIGHEELLILWDDRATTLPQGEDKKFTAALASAKSGLPAIPPSYRGQNTLTRPIPIVPRNAALRLTFSGPVLADAQFFGDNPSAIQLLEFKGDPAVVDPANAFRLLPYRAIASGNTVVLDTTILGGEAGLTGTSSGLPLSADNVTANIRIAIPSRGALSPLFYVQNDSIPQLNGIDSVGRQSVIRDFRSGNLIDGAAGRLREPELPSILGSFAMGIVEVDLPNNRVRIAKRGVTVPVRGRYPFVDGPLAPAVAPATVATRPLGPLSAPVRRPLLRGDVLTQTVQVGAETIQLRSEILVNEAINTISGTAGIGLSTTPPVGDSGQGELLTTCWVRLQSVQPGRDAAGNPVAFVADTSTPDGRDCVLKAIYHENVPFAGGSSSAVSDRAWRNLFARIDPRPQAAAQDVQPNASVAVEFTKPMDLDQVDSTNNLLVTSRPTALETFAQQLSDPKRAKSRIVTTRLTDLNGDGTVLRLQPPLGFHHRAGVAEAYALHVRLGATGVLDLAGSGLDVFDDPSNPVDSWSVDFTLSPTAAQNLSAWVVWPFEADDEDGTLPGSVDIFGQFRRENGRLIAASGVRLGRSADGQNLGTISRINRGECWDPRNPVGNPPVPATGNSLVVPTNPVDQAGIPHPGRLYWQPTMFDQVAPPNVPQVYEYFNTVPQKVGRVLEPLKPQGSRMQLRYLEDDFQLSYRQPTDFGLDVEQLYWSPFNDESVLYDVFDRVTMSLSHSRSRPDENWFLNTQPDPAECQLRPQSMNSSLSVLFSDNVLQGTQQIPVFEDAVYTINPNLAFRVAGTNFVPYPRFDRTYTWRDSRLVTVDASGNVIGLGGAQQPDALAPNDDRTANIDSPWIESDPRDRTVAPAVADPEFFAAGNSIYVMDPADFDGNLRRDHDPIALPLLVDIKVFPDDAANGIAAGANAFQMALLGPPSYATAPWGGYYDGVAAGFGGRPRWPNTRVQASGGFDLITGNPILVDPANQLTAATSIVKDAGYGAATTALFAANPGDGMLPWARADFVRKVSNMTFGFFDSLQPQRAIFVDGAGTATTEGGIPDLLAIGAGLRISDLVVQLDPPQVRQPAGTAVVVEVRGADGFANSDVLYNPGFTSPTPGFTPSDAFNVRGNLLNANYACEAYRYSTANFTGGVPRVAAQGLTRYVTEDQLALIRNESTNLLPRFLNVRVTMTNNVDVSPSLSPSLRSMSLVYRMSGN
jgi:hypothetical protein